MLSAAIDLLKQVGAWQAISVIIAIAVARYLWDIWVNRS